jgi:rRNA maturation protein Nop10
MKLKKCPKCKTYTLKEICTKCKTPTANAHYKFLNLRDAPKSDVRMVRKN